MLVGSARYYFGSYGRIIMGVIVLLACLTTSVGLITACAEYFSRLIPALSYTMWVSAFSIISFFVALFGLTTIIKAAIPVLMFLYPLTISLVILTFAHSIYGDYRSVYRAATFFTLIPSLYDGIHTAGLSLGSLDTFMASLPLAGYGLSWVSFCLAGLIIGVILSRFDKTKAVQE